MCRSIKPLFNFSPPATDEEIQEAAVQFVKKISGFTSPSVKNEAAINRAVRDITAASQLLLQSLVTNAVPRNREIEKERARVRSAKRFGNRIG